MTNAEVRRETVCPKECFKYFIYMYIQSLYFTCTTQVLLNFPHGGLAVFPQFSIPITIIEPLLVTVLHLSDRFEVFSLPFCGSLRACGTVETGQSALLNTHSGSKLHHEALESGSKGPVLVPFLEAGLDDTGVEGVCSDACTK